MSEKRNVGGFEKIMLTNDKLIYYAGLMSGLSYTYYNATKLFPFRFFAFFFAFSFYILVIKYVLQNRKKLINEFYQSSFKMIYWYILFVLILLVPSIKFNGPDIFTLIFNPYAFSGFFVAFIALVVTKRTGYELILLSRRINNFIPFFIIVDFLFIQKQPFLSVSIYFLLFELLILEKLSFKRRLYLAALFLFSVIYQISIDNRSVLLLLVGTMLVYGIFYYLKFTRKRIIKALLIAVVLLTIYILTFNFNETFLFIREVLDLKAVDTTDTRSFLFIEFFQTFKEIDWFFGRGYLGTYFSPYFYDLTASESEGGDYFIRFTVEIGYLEFLLKGGLFLLVPFLIISIKALYHGILKNEFDSLTFRYSILLLVMLVLMTLSNPPGFNAKHVFLWLIIGIIAKRGESARPGTANRIHI